VVGADEVCAAYRQEERETRYGLPQSIVGSCWTRIFASQVLLENAKVGPPRCSTVVLHRQKPEVREVPDVEGLFRY
jgi:hypothetical protein